MDMRDKLEALWIAANNHSAIVLGEWIVQEWDGPDCPPAPSDNEIMELVTEYLNSTK